jgi:hypothetical protein
MTAGKRVISCVGKSAYPTYERAWAQARAFRRQARFDRDDGPLEPYRCMYCDAWHLGHAQQLIPRSERRQKHWRYQGED